MPSNKAAHVASELIELVDLLTCRDLDTEEIDTLATSIVASTQDLDLHWLPNVQDRITWAVSLALGDYIARGDKVDELLEEIEDFFEEPFDPGIAEMADDSVELLTALRTELAVRGQDHGGYDIVFLDDMASDNLNVIVVPRSDVARITALARFLSVRIDELETVFHLSSK